MKREIRLYQRNGWFHCEFSNGQRRSLHTQDLTEANRLAEEAEKTLLEKKVKRLDRIHRITISELFQLYDQTRVGISPHTRDKDKLTVKHLIDAIGDVQVRAVSSEAIGAFKTVREAHQNKPVSINGWLMHLKTMLNFAIEEGYLDKLPKMKMIRVYEEDPERHVISLEKFNEIMRMAKARKELIWRYLTCLLWTGARRAEMLNLEWQNVLFDKSIIVLTRTKGKRDRRVPILPPVLKALEPVKKDVGRIFPAYHPGTPTRWFREISQACGFQYHLHDCRHSMATIMLEQGVDERIVMEIMGHRNLTTTRIYTHILDALKIKAVAKMNIDWNSVE